MLVDDASVSADFRSAMRQLAASVIIVSAEHSGNLFGMTATAFNPVSMSPPTALVAVNQSAGIHQILHESDRFCVNILDARQHEQSRIFSSHSKTEERFKDAAWKRSAEGIPFLDGAVANVFCRMLERRRIGSHTLFIGEVLHVMRRDDARPLLYLDGQYIDLAAIGRGLWCQDF